MYLDLTWLWAFLSGAFLINAIPHFVHGVSGERFFTPFSRLDGAIDGRSSALLNVFWAGFNIVLGYWLLQLGQICVVGNDINKVLFIVGGVLISIILSVTFTRREARVHRSEKKS
jgi:hypothetical protein